MPISKDHGHACSVETIGPDVAIFRNSILTLSVKRMQKEIESNRITLQAAILDCSEAAVHSYPFLKIYPGNTAGRVLILIKLQTDCSEWRLYTKMTPPTLEAAAHSHPFSKIYPGNPVVESFFWSNNRLAVQSGDYILK